MLIPGETRADTGSSGADGARGLAAWTLALWLAFLPACEKGPTGPRLHRIMDELGESDVLETPLRGLLSELPRQTDTLGKETCSVVGPREENGPRFLECPTRSPVLLVRDGGEPREMTVWKDGKALPYSPITKCEPGSWTLVRSQREIPINLTAEKGQSHGMDLFLPSGEYGFEILATNPAPKEYLPVLQLLLDRKPMGEVEIGEKPPYSLSARVEGGFHRLEVSFDRVRALTPIDERWVLCSLVGMRITGPSDVVLIPLPTVGEEAYRNASFQVSYPALPPRETRSAEKQLALSRLSMYQVATGPSFSVAGSEANGVLGHLRKRLRDPVRSYDVLFAPTRTDLAYGIRVPKGASLEFGLGLLEPAYGKRKAGVRFQVLARVGKEETVLFRTVLGSGKNQDKTTLGTQRIDLGPFRNREVQLRFLTEAAPCGKKKCKALDVGLAYWVDPVVTTPSRSPADTNVILISLDTLRADHVGRYGYDRPTSPAMDQLASEAVQFETALSPTTWTLPAHVSMMTGLRPFHHGVLLSFQRMRPSLVTLAEILRAEGFTTAAFTGGGYVSAHFGFAKGFVSYQDDGLGGELSADGLAKRTIEWLEENKAKRFFLFLHTYQTHDPYQTSAPLGKTFLGEGDEWKGLFLQKWLGGPRGKYRKLTDGQTRNLIDLYDGEILYTDQAFVKPLIERLKQLGLYDRTLIVLTSDHGEEFYDHGAWLHGQSVYNELVHVPLIVKFPGAEFAGKRVREAVSTLDIFPTILALLGIDPGKYRKGDGDGENLMPLVREDKKSERVLLGELFLQREFPSPPIEIDKHLGDASVREGRYKLVLEVNPREYCLFHSPPCPQKEEVETHLFDVESDPGEKVDIAAQNPERVGRLMETLGQYFPPSKGGETEDEALSVDSALKENLQALGYVN